MTEKGAAEPKWWYQLYCWESTINNIGQQISGALPLWFIYLTLSYEKIKYYLEVLHLLPRTTCLYQKQIYFCSASEFFSDVSTFTNATLPPCDNAGQMTCAYWRKVRISNWQFDSLFSLLHRESQETQWEFREKVLPVCSQNTVVACLWCSVEKLQGCRTQPLKSIMQVPVTGKLTLYRIPWPVKV